MLVLHVRRRLQANVESVFDAWTNPEALKAWWGPVGVTCTAARIDLRPGGHYAIDNLLADGTTVTISGEFREVERPRLLVYTWTTGRDSQAPELVTLRLASIGNETDLEICHERIASEQTREQHRGGWDGCLDGFSSYLGKREPVR
jgi:uncharacterized protein YndB with AHSA1/START domain